MTGFSHYMFQPPRHRLGILLGCMAVGILAGPLLAEEAASPPVIQAPAPDLEPAPTPVNAEPGTADPSITLRGSVWRSKAGIVFLKTPVGLLTLSSKTTLKDLKGSHEVTFWVHERSSVIEIRKKGDGSLVHRYFTGPMTPGTDAPKTLRWWTAEGDQTVHCGTQEARLSSYHDGDQLTVEVDESRTIIGVHDLQFDLQISQPPPSGSPAHLLLSGTVSKLKSNFVFFRTPVGVVMVNAKVGVPRVKVGQPMTLRIENGQVAVDLTPNNAQPPRTTTSSAP